jgi:hypothetical protein
MSAAERDDVPAPNTLDNVVPGPGDEGYVRPVEEGFVRMVHVGTANTTGHGGIGDVPESSVGVHRSLGWVPLVETEPDDDGTVDTPDEAPASDDPLAAPGED